MMRIAPEVQVALATYVVPALVTAYLVLRQRRVMAASKHEVVRAASRQTDWEASQELRDELRQDNADLRQRVTVLECRVKVLTELCMRHGLRVPDWLDKKGAAG